MDVTNTAKLWNWDSLLRKLLSWWTCEMFNISGPIYLNTYVLNLKHGPSFNLYAQWEQPALTISILYLWVSYDSRCEQL
jgi:hypothetical protein